ncbi:MAG: acetate--CoA ligase [Oligoflexia bacterium]
MNWQELARTRLEWFKPFTKVKNTSFKKPVLIRWFEDGELNASVQCLDRHAIRRAQQPAIIWESDDPSEPSRTLTYKQLLGEVERMSHVLRRHGVKKGDRVTIYLPMIPEAAVAMLSCARVGAIHSVVFGGFSAEALAGRIQDCQSSFVITADEGLRAGKKILLKANVDEALKTCPSVGKVLVVRRTGGEVSWIKGRDLWWSEERESMDELPRVAWKCAPESMNAEDPLFILYTSGSTGKPKGVLHTTAGYLLYAGFTHEKVFGCKPGDIYFCTADVGWVTGHSYVVYGPLSNGVTTLMFEGVPQFPTASRHWEIVDKHKVSVYYTAPTAIRALMREGDAPVACTSRDSLKVLGTVGEPINPEAWNWYHRVVGKGRCPIVDTWWQTETGGILISPIAGETRLKPGSATFPLPGIEPVMVDLTGRVLDGPGEGNLCIADSWPGQARTLYGDHERFEQIYFSTYPGLYFTGDGCRRDEEGYYWITGRVDDVINVAGHRLGTAEIESALVGHASVAEAAVVGFPHEIKGQGIYAYVTLKAGVEATQELRAELVAQVRKAISPIATPDVIQWAPRLPKTRSGKIMRRILRKVAQGEFDQVGDTSTLADPDCVRELVANREQSFSKKV